ncbi:DUF397 domain-containing protein [Streptomyces sp. TRM S81-3]|uniref:DUF397 domain-containing protein n=1 Tax=Streptomyces griseicoloratus TaxID=2752516 RepID=A0A926LAG3_9ACTN|nr:DUF397 domain-containing protein [Streptomyces griseicoloratus]
MAPLLRRYALALSDGPALVFSAAGWSSFITYIKQKA